MIACNIPKKIIFVGAKCSIDHFHSYVLIDKLQDGLFIKFNNVCPNTGII